MLTTSETPVKKITNTIKKNKYKEEKDKKMPRYRSLSITRNASNISLAADKDNSIISNLAKRNNIRTEINNSKESSKSFSNYYSYFLPPKELEIRDDNINFLQRNNLEHLKKHNTYKSDTEDYVEKGTEKKISEVNEGNGVISKVIKKSIKDFILGRTLGEGSYSTVVAARDKQTSKEYAIKILDKRHIIKEKKVKYVYIEKDTLNKLGNHPGIVQLYYTFQDERNLYFVLSLAANGELLGFVKHFGSLNEECTRYYGAQILDAVQYIHECGIIHRDLKPENVLLDDKMKIKITDFGTAKILQSPLELNITDKADEKYNTTDNDDKFHRANSFVGTAEYVSPELLMDKVAYKSSDIWAYGCIIYQLFVGRPPFKASNEYQTFQKIINLKYQFPPNFPPNARDLCEKILILDPLKRLSINELKSHAFFDGMPWGKVLWKTNPPKLKPYKTSIITESPRIPSNIIKLNSVSNPTLLPNTMDKQEKHKQLLNYPQDIPKQNTENPSLSKLNELWSSVLVLPNERLLRLGQVSVSTGKGVGEDGILSGKSPSRLSRLLHRKKTRNLLVTSEGRALFVTEESNGEKKIKSEIPLGKSNIKIRLEGNSGRLWVIETPNKIYNFDDLHERAVEWVELIERVNKERCNR
ncbi:hypothetical protein PNEG_00639 [Pneumocystis murina B123]|uniref:non-specific serine/threonine protein kinase n=1 Tax=Pneumocystis murina (strain B123) TaxID=1069680 RepID=M7NUQ9_PNEMU|nr:hypothetical protein PNEG_00639 [Pneumocystis murina B123]EMR11042.1 hypothetical protein PNEG_00639 [Pneumocystis murina B123]